MKLDCDNVAKSILDSLNGLAWRDDSRVSQLEVVKVYAGWNENPHVEIEFGTFNNPPSEEEDE